MTIPTTEEEIAFLDLSNFKNGEHVMFLHRLQLADERTCSHESGLS